MIIDCISDLHGHYPKLEGGDLLIVAGDLTAKHSVEEYHWWCNYFKVLPYKKVIFIAGNHDPFLIDVKPFKETRWWNGQIVGEFEYLCDSGTEFEYEAPSSNEWGSKEGPMGAVAYEKKKLKIWGSPWTLRFEGMNPHCMAFTVDTEEQIAEKWKLIPDDVDILVTHSPPQQVRDWIWDYPRGVVRVCGSKSLKDAYRRIRPKLHVFGHIHEGYGQDANSTTKFVNASHVNERYEPVNKPIRIIL